VIGNGSGSLKSFSGQQGSAVCPGIVGLFRNMNRYVKLFLQKVLHTPVPGNSSGK
jgi:hypothetical protein